MVEEDIKKCTHDIFLGSAQVFFFFCCSITAMFNSFIFSLPQSIEYLRSVAGCRTVPVEVGSRYTDEEWSQTLLTVNEFIDRYILNKVSAPSSSLSPALLT